MTVSSTSRLFLLLCLVLSVAVSAQPFCNCEYTAPEDFEPNCRVFGSLGSEASIPWLLASEKCVDELGVTVSTISRDELWTICPFSNSTNVNIQLLRNQLQSATSSATQTIRAAFPKFFRPDGSSSYVLRDSFLDTRNSVVDCQVSENLCWSEIRDHFTAFADSREIACQTLHAYQRTSMSEEQLLARSMLCDSQEEVPEVCLELQKQIQSYQQDSAVASCEEIGAPPPDSEDILQCDWTNPLPASSASFHGAINYKWFHSCLLLWIPLLIATAAV